jgi:hypothetical protein
MKTAAARRARMLSLKQYVAVAALRDTIVQPPKSAWHEFWAWGERHGSEGEEKYQGWKSDALGLRTLHDNGRLVLSAFDSAHTNYTMPWWKENVLPFLSQEL